MKNDVPSFSCEGRMLSAHFKDPHQAQTTPQAHTPELYNLARAWPLRMAALFVAIRYYVQYCKWDTLEQSPARDVTFKVAQ